MAEFDTGEAGTRAEAVVDRLGELYWRKTYGGQDAYEALVRTILSQNTSDRASQPAHEALLDRYGSGRDDPDSGAGDGNPGDESDDTGDLAAALAAADHQRLAETIESAGLYNQKASRIVAAAEWIRETFGRAAAFDDWVAGTDAETVRERLLDLDGVGPKTADCVLLFAGGQPGVFPVDTHVHRVARRIGIAPPDADHEAVRTALETAVPGGKCGFGHTAMIQFGREYCAARQPACLHDPDACPMADICDQVGVSPATGEVRDPAE
ncbi:MAG: endonuclease III [Haloarculaceae archaeon]